MYCTPETFTTLHTGMVVLNIKMECTLLTENMNVQVLV